MRPKGRGRLDALELEDGPKRRWPGTPEVKEPTLEDIFETHRDAFRRAEAYIRQTEGRSRA